MRIHIYGKPSCSYCDAARTLLDSLSIEYIYIDISRSPDIRFQFKAQGHKTVPIVVIDDVTIGGYNELVSFISNIRSV